MAHKIGITLELLDEEKRDSLLEELSELLKEHKILSGKIVVTREIKQGRSTRKVVDSIELDLGQTFDLSEFGLVEDTPIERAIKKLGADAVTLTTGGRTTRIA